MSAAGRRYLSMLHELRCVVHWFCYGQMKPAQEAHHLESVRGEHSDFAAVPLCKQCHDQLHGMRRKPFYLAHKLDDLKLLAWTAQLVQIHQEQRKAA